MTIAALFVAKRGCYIGLPDVDPWTEDRDARLYAGPWPVVAHPPCSTWCRLAGLVEARWGKKKGDDGGCFASALESVRRWGGVLEHPAHTDAWVAYGLPEPSRRGWTRTLCGGWVCYVEQHRYGHPAKKGTWLYCVLPAGVTPPSMRWGFQREGTGRWRVDGAERIISWCRNNRLASDTRPTVSNKQAKATPPEFRDALLAIARLAGKVTA